MPPLTDTSGFPCHWCHCSCGHGKVPHNVPDGSDRSYGKAETFHKYLCRQKIHFHRTRSGLPDDFCPSGTWSLHGQASYPATLVYCAEQHMCNLLSSLPHPRNHGIPGLSHRSCRCHIHHRADKSEKHPDNGRYGSH